MNRINIFINVYVHYPEAYNETIVSSKLDSYFEEYFKESQTYVKFHTAPANENQIIVIEASIEKIVDIDKLKLQWNEYLLVYFNHEIKEIIYKII